MWFFLSYKYSFVTYRTMRVAHGVVWLCATQMLAGIQLLYFMNLTVSVDSKKSETSLLLQGT